MNNATTMVILETLLQVETDSIWGQVDPGKFSEGPIDIGRETGTRPRLESAGCAAAGCPRDRGHGEGRRFGVHRPV